MSRLLKGAHKIKDVGASILYWSMINAMILGYVICCDMHNRYNNVND
jgi:hypothetical protein